MVQSTTKLFQKPKREMGLGKFQNEKPQKIRHQKLSDPYKYSDQ